MRNGDTKAGGTSDQINFVYWLAIRKSRAPADTAATWDHYTGQLN